MTNARKIIKPATRAINLTTGEAAALALILEAEENRMKDTERQSSRYALQVVALKSKLNAAYPDITQ